jgi:hypothetical protein
MKHELTARERIDRIELFLRLDKAAKECQKAGVKPDIAGFLKEYRTKDLTRNDPAYQKEYQRNYYQQNRESLLKYQKAYQKEYRQRRREEGL